MYRLSNPIFRDSPLEEESWSKEWEVFFVVTMENPSEFLSFLTCVLGLYHLRCRFGRSQVPSSFCLCKDLAVLIMVAGRLD